MFTAAATKEEVFHITIAAQQLPEVARSSLSQSATLLYSTLLHSVFRLTGTSETAIRSVSLFFMLMTLIFIFLLASAVWSKKTALYATFLTAANPFLFYLAFKGGPYTMIMFMGVASMYFFMRKKVKIYILTTILALYTHPVVIFILPVHIFGILQDFLIGEKKRAGKMFKGAVVVLIFFLPLVFLLIKNPSVLTGCCLNTISPYESLKDAYLAYLAGDTAHPLTSPALYMVLVLAIIRDWTQKIRKSLFLLLWFFLPSALAWMTAKQFGLEFPLQMLSIALPGATLILASGKRVPASNMVIVVLVILLGVINYNIFTNNLSQENDGNNLSAIETSTKTDIEE